MSTRRLISLVCFAALTATSAFAQGGPKLATKPPPPPTFQDTLIAQMKPCTAAARAKDKTSEFNACAKSADALRKAMGEASAPVAGDVIVYNFFLSVSEANAASGLVLIGGGKRTRDVCAHIEASWAAAVQLDPSSPSIPEGLAKDDIAMARATAASMTRECRKDFGPPMSAPAVDPETT